MAAVRESIGRLDSSLIEAADRARTRMWYQINRLHRRASRAELLRNEVISRHADALCHALFPYKVLQEREVAGVSFVARYGAGLLADLYQKIHPDCHDHQVIALQ
jgi:ferric-dicitrate binding protein FerR (iron transport regulator)